MSKPPTLSPQDADHAFAAAQVVVQIHRALADYLKVGLTLAQIDQFVAERLADHGCKSCFLGYKPGSSPPFPSHACLSVNDCVVHGTHQYYQSPMKIGDLLKIDIGSQFKPRTKDDPRAGWIGDAAWTYSFGKPSSLVRRLMDCGKESLRRGVAELRPGNTYLSWAQAVQRHVEEECGFHLVRGLGGHGYGKKLHEAPYVANVVPRFPGEWPDATAKCMPGTLVAVEPMIGVGTGDTHAMRIKNSPSDRWPVMMNDGAPSVHYEHDVLITEKGPRILTDGLQLLPDEIG